MWTFSQYGQRQDSERTLMDSEETYCSELDTADSQNKVFMDLSHSRPVIKFDMFSIFACHLHSLTQLEKTEILQTLTNISIYNAYCAHANFLWQFLYKPSEKAKMAKERVSICLSYYGIKPMVY